MKTIKEEILEMVSEMPDNVGYEDVMEALYVKEKIEEGKRDIKEGRYSTTEELLKEVETWQK
jgi:hypothetical protein